MSQTFWTSDLHAGHGNIIKYSRRDQFLNGVDRTELIRRGNKWDNGVWKDPTVEPWHISQQSIDNMNQELFAQINRMVGRNDILYLLGDFAFSRTDYLLACKRYRDQINCLNVHLIWGNHDKAGLEKLFSSNHHLLDTTIHKQRMTMCHYSMNVWNRSHREAWNLYGHSHAQAEEGLDIKFPGRRSLDVGVDNAYRLFGQYRPFSMDDLHDYMKNRPGHQIGHH